MTAGDCRFTSVQEDTIMGFLDQVRQGAQQTAWQADRMMRQNRAGGAVNDARRDLDTQTFNLGKTVLQTYDAGSTPAPEAAPVYDQIQALRAKIQQLEQEVERIKVEQPPQAAPSPPPPPAYAPPPGGPPPYAPGGPPPYAPGGPPPGGYAPPGPGGYAPQGQYAP